MTAHRGLSVLLMVLVLATQAAAEGAADRGAEVFRASCTPCHEIGDGAQHGIGPALGDIFSRAAADLEGFPYSPALRQAAADGLVWQRETLDAFLANPLATVPGTRMVFPGLSDANDRADIIAYLTRTSGTRGDAMPEVAPEILALKGDAEYGEYLSSECTTCHRTDGADAGIPSIVSWPVDDFVRVMHAYRSGDRSHQVMNMVAGRLGDEEIAALAAYFATANR